MKVTIRIPREIGEWIEYCKYHNISLYGALCLTYDFSTPSDRVFKGDNYKCMKWARENSNEFAYAWVNGYEVDEKYYYVAIPIENGKYRRLYVLSSGRLALGGLGYDSIEIVKKRSRENGEKITEKMIKDSPLSWAWQFAKELEL